MSDETTTEPTASGGREASECGGLLPCPFCGDTGPEVVDAILMMQPAYMVECSNCAASRMASKNRETAIKRWNERAR